MGIAALRAWLEEALKDDIKTYGAYLALLYLRFNYSYSGIPAEGKQIRELLKSHASHLLIGPELKKALDSIEDFVNRLFGEWRMRNSEERNRFLEELECEHFEKFRDAAKKLVARRLENVEREALEELPKAIEEVLNKDPDELTSCGSGRYWFTGPPEYMEILDVLGIGVRSGNEYYIPAFFRAGEFLEDVRSLITGHKPAPEAQPYAETTLIEYPPTPERFKGLKPAREVLESIVATALSDLGFSVRTNISLATRHGIPIEVDVWATKRAVNTEFRVYVSCKNWDRDVDRSVIDEEFGRVNNLREIPHLRIIIAKSLTTPAREAALADGFLVIELGEKAGTESADEIYRHIYSALNQLFTSIAPPRLLKLVSRVSSVVEELTRIREELASLIQKQSL